MKKILSSGIAVALVLLLTSALYIYPSNFKKQPIIPQVGKGFAVLELFTSEGCSSCPHADELLKKLQKEYAGQPVYLLAYHVDYWDRQGWKDVFSDPAFSKRQRWYNNKFTSQVYTPQLIINGSAEFVGSDEAGIRKSMAAALKSDLTTAAISGRLQGSELDISYEANTNDNVQLVLAFVQKQAQTNVKAGENKGRTLPHVQIVKSLITVDVKGQGSKKIALPVGYKAKDWEVVSFIQDLATGGISAAALIQ